MKKFFSVLIIMLAVFLGALAKPAFADTSVVVKSGESQLFRDASYNNNRNESQIENSGTVTIRNCKFQNNYLDEPNKRNRNFSTIYNNGGTITLISETDFWANYTYTNGGAISSVVGVIEEISGSINADGTYSAIFHDNESSIGGAIWNNKSSRIDLIKCVMFKHNTAKSNGGAIYNTGTLESIEDSVFDSNEAGQADNSLSAGYGGAIYSTKNITVNNTDFLGNKAGRNGGAIAMMSGNLTLNAKGETYDGAAKSVLFMNNLAGKNKNDLYFGGKGQILNLYAQDVNNKVVLDGGISIANDLKININKPTNLTGNNGEGSVYINGDVGSDKTRANLYIYGGTLSLSNNGTSVYDDTAELSLNTIWANKVTLYHNTKLEFDIYLNNDGTEDTSEADHLKFNSLSGSGSFVLDEDSFHYVEGYLDKSFTSSFKLIDTKVNIGNRVVMYDQNGKSTKVLYLYERHSLNNRSGEDNDNRPLYKVRLATDGTVIFSNPYYIDEKTNSLAYAINSPAINEIEHVCNCANKEYDCDCYGHSYPEPCIGLDWSYTLNLTKNIKINSWEDLPDAEKNLQPRNTLVGDRLYIYGKNKTITAEDNLVGFIVDKNCRGEAKYLYAEKTSFIDFNNAITNNGGRIDLNNVSFTGNGLVDVNNNKNILTLRGGAITNLSGEMNIAGTKKSPKSNFYNNKAKEGGAVYNSGVMTIDYSTFGGVTKNAGKKNEKTFLNSAIYGGAIYNYQNATSNLKVNNTKFIANTAVDGGAIYNSYDKGTTLLDNYVVYNGMVYDIGGEDFELVDQYFDGAILHEGQIVYDGNVYNGAVEVEKYIHPTTLADAAMINKATFTYNKAEKMGGAIYNMGNLTVESSTFGKTKKNANVAGEAGAAVANLGDGVFTSKLSNYYYSTGNKGGAIYNTDNAVTHLEGGTFSSNTAKYCGGVVFNDKDAVLTLNAYTNPDNNKKSYLTMSKNTAIYGGAIYNKGTVELADGMQNLSGTYTSNKATYGAQQIVYKEHTTNDPRKQMEVEKENLAAVAKLVTGNYDFVAKDSLPEGELVNGKTIYYDYVAPKGGAIYNDGTILKEDEVAFGDKIYKLNEIKKVDEYTPEGYLDVENGVKPLVSTDYVRDNLVYDMSNASERGKYITQTVLEEGQIAQRIINDPTKPEGWIAVDDGITTQYKYNDPTAKHSDWFVFDGAKYDRDYVVGTPLVDGMIVAKAEVEVEDGVYELLDCRFTGAKYVTKYVEGNTYDPETQMVYNLDGTDYIFNYEIKGEFKERTVLKENEFRWKDSPEGDAVWRGQLTPIGPYNSGLEDGQIVWKDDVWNGAVKGELYVAPSILEAGEFVYNGYIYSGKAIDLGEVTDGTILKSDEIRVGNSVYGRAQEVGPYVPPTQLNAGEKVIDGVIYSGLVNTHVTYVEGTPLKNGQILVKNRDDNLLHIFNNARYVAKYREGTELKSNQIVVGSRGEGYIYNVPTEARLEYVEDPKTLDNAFYDDKYGEGNWCWYGNYIYDLTNAAADLDAEGEKRLYVAPIKPATETEIIYNGIIYDTKGGFDTGIVYVKPSEFNSETQIVINGVIYDMSNAEYVGPYEPGSKLGPNQRVINGVIYDLTNAVYRGQFINPNRANTANGQIEHNGRVYDITGIKGGTVPYVPGTRLGPNQHVIDGYIYDFANANKVGKYNPPTQLDENNVVIDGIVYDTTNVEHVGKYEEGTVLGDNEYRIDDNVYKLINTGIEYIKPVLPDKDKGEVVVEQDGEKYIYDISDATNRGLYIKPTKLDANEVLYDGKVYDISNAEKGDIYNFETELEKDEIVYNGHVYSNVVCRGTYVPGTELGDDEIVYNGYVYANAKPIGDYIKGQLNINQANFKSNTATVKVVLKDNNSYTDETQMGLRYTQQITYYVGKGGAIYNASEVPVNIWSTKFTSNKAARYGGAICNENENSDLNIENAEFKSNTAKSVVTTVKTYIITQGLKLTKKKQTIKENVGYGGAIFTLGNVYVNINPLFNNLVRTTSFTKNSAAYGGAIFAVGEVVIGADTKFTSNSSLFDGGAIYCDINKPLITPAQEEKYGKLVKLTDFDFSRLQSSLQQSYIYEHSVPINYDVKITKATFSKNSAKGNGGAILGNKISVEGSTFTSNKATYVKNTNNTGKGGAIYAMGDIVVNPYSYTPKEESTMPKTVFKSNTARDGGAIYAGGTSLIKNSEFTSNKASGGYGGALYSTDDALIVGSTFNKNSSAYGGAIYLGSNTTSYIINTSITNNTASKAGGGIYLAEDSTLYIMSYAKQKETINVSITGNKAAGKANDIFMEQGSKLYVCAINYGDGKANVTINNVQGQTVDADGNPVTKNTAIYLRTVNGGTITVKKIVGVTLGDIDGSSSPATSDNTGFGTKIDIVAENLIKACSFYLSGSTVNMINYNVGAIEAENVELADGTVTKARIDVNLQNGTSDKFQAQTITGTGIMTASEIHVTENSKTPVTIAVGKDSVINSISTKTAESAEATYKLKSYYDEDGRLRVVAYGQKAKPAAVAAPVAAQIGGYLTQINSYDQAFMNMDLNMIRPRAERESDCECSGKWKVETGKFDNDDISYNAKGLWNRPYATFERVNLNNGPKVSNVGYGNFFGGDADMKELNNGWKRQFSAYIGYNGSVQDYDRQSIDQNGGTVGVTEVWYKKNFFTGLTLNAGANVAQASTDLGRENMPMFMTGIASKTGYNFEFKEGKFIVQPSILLSYSFIHTFSHDNGRGSHVGSSPLNAIQVAPGIKFIANLKNGWQPYLGVNMRWNIIDKTHFSLQDVTIPDMSIDPYVEYGIGLQRRWGERFTGFGQAMIRNGGRNGVMLSFGFKWLIGR